MQCVGACNASAYISLAHGLLLLRMTSHGVPRKNDSIRVALPVIPKGERLHKHQACRCVHLCKPHHASITHAAVCRMCMSMYQNVFASIRCGKRPCACRALCRTCVASPADCRPPSLTVAPRLCKPGRSAKQPEPPTQPLRSPPARETLETHGRPLHTSLARY